jgi:hypothetical protein
LKALFNKNRADVAVNGNQSEPFPLHSGVVQGSPLSPVLYALFVDDMVDKLNGMKDFPGATRLAGRLFRCLLYADDKMLSVVEEFSLHHRFRFGIKKCAVLPEMQPSCMEASP